MRKTFSLFVTFMVFTIVSISDAANYYVRTDGNNTGCTGLVDAAYTGSGSGQPCAWSTIQKAADTINGGDICIVGNGTYVERVQISRSGSPGNILTIQAQNKWLAIVDNRAQGFNIVGNYIKIDGFKVQGYVFSSQYSAVNISGTRNIVTNIYSNQNQYISIAVSGTYNTVSNSYILKPQFGISVSGTGHLIENNEVDQLVNYWVGVDTDYSRYFGNDHIFRGNYYHGADVARLTAAGSHIDCFQTFTEGGNTNSNNILIERNYCSDCAEGIMPSATTGVSDGLVVRNNVFANFGAYGVVPYKILNVKIYNNTFIANGGLYGAFCYDRSTCHIENNIFYNVAAGTETPYGLATGSTWISGPGKNNLLYNQNKSYSAVTYPNDIVNKDPLFVSSFDYKLQSTSPAKGVGAIISGWVGANDFFGEARPSGSPWDLGAYNFKTEQQPGPARNLRILNAN